MAGKKFAAEFALRRNVSAQDKILIQDSDDDVVKYAYPPQIASLSGYAYAQSVADLPLLPSNKSIGYIVGQMLYIYVGMGGDTKDGLYQSVGFFVGPQGVQGEKGEKGERGEQGVQGPKGDNGGLSLQELDVYLATKQYVTGDTLADMLAGYVSNTSLMRDYVTIAKTQDVTGVKNFTAGVQFGGLPMYKSKDDTVYLDANLVVRGGVTMYGSNLTTSPSIFEALPIDNDTIKRNAKGELYAAGRGGSGTGGGGVADSVAWSNVTNKPTWITDTKPKYSYSEILDTPDLSVYAIKSSVDNALSGKADKATTLAGYGITNAYTKSEVNATVDSINTSISNLRKYADDTFVTISTEQNILAVKDFDKGLKIGGISVSKLEGKDIIYIDANLVVRGGVTMYGDNGQTLPSIWASIPFDSTMKWDGSTWSVGGGGSGEGGLDLVQLEEYLTTNGYATQSWVTGKGYITSSALEPYALKTAIPTNTNQLTNGAGFITGITSSMVTNALGYTPYNSSNPDGYITSSGSITGNAATSNRLVEEVVTDLNNATAGRIFTMTSGYGSTAGNKPTEYWVTGLTLTYGQNSSFRRQLAFADAIDESLYLRAEHIGVWGEWSKVLTSSNFYDYALPLTGGKINGDLEVAGGLYSSVGNLRIKSKVAPMAGVEIAVSDTDYWQISHRGIYANNELHFYHNANGTWSNSVLSLSANGDVATGGNLLAKGAITMYYSSDKRLKQNIRKVDASKTLLSLGGVYQYEYIDSEVSKNSTYEGSHYGLIYQNVKGTALDKMCHEREDGFGTLNYLDTNFISLIAGATMENISEVEKLKRKIRSLEAQVKQLESRA